MFRGPQTWLGWGIVILLIWWVATDPASAANTVQNIGHLLTKVANGFSTVLSRV